MSFTYDVSKLNSSKLYQLRLLIGQTNEYSSVALQDEELQYFLSQNYDNVNMSAIDAVNSQISQAAALVDSETGEVSEAQSQLLKNLIRLRDDLESSSRNVPKFMEITGIFNDDRDTIDNDEEIYQDGVKLNDKGISDSIMADSNFISDANVHNL